MARWVKEGSGADDMGAGIAVGCFKVFIIVAGVVALAVAAIKIFIR